MDKSFSSGVGEIRGASDIEALKGPQLIQLHNELVPEKQVKKFADRKTALKRCLAALEARLGGGAAKAPAAAKRGSSKAAAAPAEDVEGRTYRPDSNRGKVIDLASVKGGATYKALKKATGWDDAALGAALGRIKNYSGLIVGISGEGDDRVIKIDGKLLTRKAFDFPPKAEIRTHQPDTKRAQALGMLTSKQGATFEEIQEAIGWDDRTTYEGIRLLNTYLGYGLRQEGEKIFAYTGSAKILKKEVKEKKEKSPKKAA